MRRTTLTTALGLTLSGLIVLAGCSTDSGTESETSAAETSTKDGAAADTADDSAAAEEGAGSTEGAAAMSDPVCAGFFQTGPVTLAERATKDRDLLAAGEALDPASWGEISLLNQRIALLEGQAEGDQGALLERVNAPFVEATDAVLSDDEKSPTDEDIVLPEIDVTDSGAAQDELEAACAG